MRVCRRSRRRSGGRRRFGLTPLDINIIMLLLTYWWEPENLSRPSKKSIVAVIAVEPRTVQRGAEKLARKRLRLAVVNG